MVSKVKFPCIAILDGSMGMSIEVCIESEDDKYYYGCSDDVPDKRFLKRKGVDGQARVGYAISRIVTEDE